MPFIWIVITLLLMAFAVISLRHEARRLDDMIDSWASDNSLTIVSKERRLLFKGPMTWTSGRTQRVFRITASDQQGWERSGWLRCGGRWSGLYSDRVEARWD